MTFSLRRKLWKRACAKQVLVKHWKAYLHVDLWKRRALRTCRLGAWARNTTEQSRQVWLFDPAALQ
jgi:hypothetical protein